MIISGTTFINGDKVSVPLPTMHNMTDEEIINAFGDSDDPVVRNLCSRLSESEHIEPSLEVSNVR